MKITVLNGSPKGDISVTMQYVEYLSIVLSEMSFETINIAKDIRGIEAKPEKLDGILKTISNSDLILFAFPIYYTTVPSQYMRFMELIASDQNRLFFKGKKVALLTTSIHFFDHTAHDYMRAVIDKLEMKFTFGFSADMMDLTTKPGKEKLTSFAKKLEKSIMSSTSAPKRFLRHSPISFKLKTSKSDAKLNSGNKKIIILADSDRSDSNLPAMIERFQSNFETKPQIVWLKSLNMVSGCMGCLKCAMDLKCVFTDKDGHRELMESTLKDADIIVMASDISNCFLSSTWQSFFTRFFYNGHVPLIKNIHIGFIFSGPLSYYPYIREIFEGFFGHSNNGIYDYLSDECENGSDLEAQLDRMAITLLEDSENGYIEPPKFQAVSAHKIFRDEIYDRLGVIFQNDHKYYKKNGLYDFPTKRYGKRLINKFLYCILNIPGLKKRAYTKELIPGMLRPFKKELKKNLKK
jgi:multimeric flavodoxin WrbA